MHANTRKQGREDANQMLLNASCKSWDQTPNLVQMKRKSQIHPEQSSFETWAKLLFGHRTLELVGRTWGH